MEKHIHRTDKDTKWACVAVTKDPRNPDRVRVVCRNEAENEVNIAKIAWLSNKNNGKAYGSMVIYSTKSADARKLLEKEWFDFNGESGYTRIFETKATPTQCYNCQQVGHKAFSCNRPQVCARCSKEGHHHKDCITEVPKCAVCKGPHESLSGNCKSLRSAAHE